MNTDHADAGGNAKKFYPRNSLFIHLDL